MTRTLPAWAPLLPLSFILAFGACAGGGCGSEPDKGTGAAQAGSQSKASVKTGGTVDASQFDSKAWDPARTGAQGHDGAGPSMRGPLAPPRVDWLTPVLPAEWDLTVLRSSGPVLVMIARADCADCALAGAALKSLEPKFTAWIFRRFDAQAQEAPSLLPSGLSLKTPPAFAIYEKGEASSTLGRMPFPRAQNETDGQYQNRLWRWFRDALIQKSLGFGQRRPG